MCTCWSRPIRLERCLRRCGSAANRMCRPSTSGTGAAEPCGRGGSSPAWCRQNGMCSRSWATSNSIRCAPAWWHCQPSTAGRACTRIWGVQRASSSRRTRSICILAAMQRERVSFYATWLHAGLAPRGRTFNPPPPPAGARLGRPALPGNGETCIRQTNEVHPARPACREDLGGLIASVPPNSRAPADMPGPPLITYPVPAFGCAPIPA